MSIDGVPLHQILFRLATRAPQATLGELMQRTVTSIANYYGAVACSTHTDASGWAAPAAEPIRAMRKMAPLDRARQQTIEARLVREVVGQKHMLSALDLEERDEVEDFFQRTLGVIDIFAFPLAFEEKVRAVLVLYLSMDSDPLAEADIHGLLAVGELLALAETETAKS
ncbi:MAG: hypothetical protein ACC662_00345 [Planctomycetota bacterium]